MASLREFLAKFDRTIDHDHLQRVWAAYEALFDWQVMDELPFVWTQMPPIADSDWPDWPYNDAFVDMEKMLISQLRGPFVHHQARDYQPLAIRANYGTVILPTILGASYQLTDTSMPWAHHLPDRDAIRRIVDAGIPDLNAGLGHRCFETAEYYMEQLSPFENLAQTIRIYHPDLQGPFDVAHLLWGPDIFVGLYDCPELVHALLDLVTETYIAWLAKWKSLVGEGNDMTAHWSTMMRGGAMIRNDTPVMLSTWQYEEFVQPYDQRILDTFGGCIHFCGRGDQFVEHMSQSRNLYGIHASQPELNDMAHLWELVRERKLVLLMLEESWVPVETRQGVTVLKAWRA